MGQVASDINPVTAAANGVKAVCHDCNVFVCNVWKAAGVFSDIGDDIQCGETSVNDNYRLAVYSDQPTPSYCLAADPNNPLCQLTGQYQLRLDSHPGVAPR